MNLKSQPAIKRLTYSLGYGNDINSKCRLQENLLFWLLYGGGTNFFMELIVSDCIAGERGCKEKKWTSFTCRHRYDMEPTLAESKHNTRTFFGRCSKQFGNCFTRKHKTLRRRKKNRIVRDYCLLIYRKQKEISCEFLSHLSFCAIYFQQCVDGSGSCNNIMLLLLGAFWGMTSSD